MSTFFTADEIGQLKETNSRLTEKIEQQEITISQLKEALENVIYSLTYLVVLEISSASHGTMKFYRFQFSWPFQK